MNPTPEWADTAVMPMVQHGMGLRYAPVTPRSNTLREVLTTAFRDRRRIALAFLFPFLATLVLCFLPTPRYTADASLLLRVGREYMYKPETADGPSAQPMAYDREQTLHAEVEILNSRDVKEAVLDRIGPTTLYPALAAGNRPDPAKQRDAALLEVQRRFDAALLKDSNVVHLAFTHPDAQLSARVLNTLIDVYLDRRRAIFNTSSLRGAEADLASLRARLTEADGKLEDWKRSHKIQSFTEQQTLLLTQRQAVAMKLADNDYQQAQSSGRTRSLNASLGATPADVTLSNETQRSESLDLARKTLLDLRLKERDLSAKFTDENLAVQDVRADIARTESFIADLMANPSRLVKTGRSVVRDSLESDLVRSMAEQRQTAASRATLVAQRDAIEHQLTQLSAAQRELDTLDRDRRLVAAAYEQASRRVEDEIVVEHLDQRRKSSVSVLQAARTPLQSKNIRSVILIVGTVVSLGCALLVAFFSALWRDTYLSPEEVQRGLGLPLLAAVPRRALS